METMMPLEYQRRMDKIIAKGGDVNETLIALLDEAKRFTIASDVTKRVTEDHIVDANKKVNHIEDKSELVKSGLSKRRKSKHLSISVVKKGKHGQHHTNRHK
jgi:hypothetical protein